MLSSRPGFATHQRSPFWGARIKTRVCSCSRRRSDSSSSTSPNTSQFAKCHYGFTAACSKTIYSPVVMHDINANLCKHNQKSMLNLNQGPRSVPLYTRAISCLLLGNLQVLFPDSVQLSLAEFVLFLISDGTGSHWWSLDIAPQWHPWPLLGHRFVRGFGLFPWAFKLWNGDISWYIDRHSVGFLRACLGHIKSVQGCSGSTKFWTKYVCVCVSLSLSEPVRSSRYQSSQFGLALGYPRTTPHNPARPRTPVALTAPPSVQCPWNPLETLFGMNVSFPHLLLRPATSQQPLQG